MRTHPIVSIAVLLAAGCAMDSAPDENVETIASAAHTGSNAVIRFRVERHIYGEQAGDMFGSALAPVGDWDGDGRADLAIGMSGESQGRGCVQVRSGATGAVIASVDGANVGDGYGEVLAPLSDIDGDGLDELIVASPGDETTAGFVHVLSGGTLALVDALDAPAAGLSFGTSAAAAGDVNGDGIEDVIVGAPGVDRAYVYTFDPAAGAFALFRTVAPPLGDAEHEIRHDLGPHLSFGQSVAGVGDLNADGFDDYVIGGPTSLDPVGDEAGVAIVMSGHTDGFMLFHEHGEVRNDGASIVEPKFGHTVAAAGDYNGDGTPDVAISGYKTWDVVTQNFTDTGKVTIWDGHSHHRGDLLTAWQPSHEPTYQPSYYYTGYAMAGGADFDADGHTDLVVGAPGFWSDLLSGSEGRVFVLEGNEGNDQPSFSLDYRGQHKVSDSPLYAMGTAVAVVGDVNGDGLDDIAVSSPYIDEGGQNRGQVTILTSYRLGDVNGDGAVDISDVSNLANYLFQGGATPAICETGDANMDGALDISDVQGLAGFLFQGDTLPNSSCASTTLNFDCSAPAAVSCD